MGKSIFQALREAEQEVSAKALNEETETEETGKEGSGAEEQSGDEGKVGSLNEEMDILICSDCGAVLGSVSEEEMIECCPCCEGGNMCEKTVKVVKEGKIIKKTVKTKKKRLTAAQKQALAKARKKAHTSSANKKRAKSVNKGRKAGLYEGDYCECPECGFTGECTDFERDGDEFICPECGASFINDDCKD